MLDDMRQAIQDMVLPEFRTLQTTVQVEFRRLDEKIDGLNDKINSFREEFRSEIRRLDSRIDALNDRVDSLEKSLNDRIDSLEKQMIAWKDEFKGAIDVHERIAALEAKISH